MKTLFRTKFPILGNFKWKSCNFQILHLTVLSYGNQKVSLDTAPCTTDTSKLLNSYCYNLGVIIILIDEKTSTYRYTYEHGKALISNKLVPKY